MAHLRSRRRLALAVPVVLSLTASLGFLPGAASAAPLSTSASTRADGPNLAYVVNTTTDHRTIASVKKAITAAGGSVVIAYEQIGVIVVHSADPDFGRRIRAVRGVQSAGATRTAPLAAAGTTDEGAAKVLSAAEAAKVSRSAAAGQEPLEADQWDLRAIGADKAAKADPGSRKVTVAVIDVGVDDTHPDIAPNFSPPSPRTVWAASRTPRTGPGVRWTPTTTTARMSRVRSPRPATASGSRVWRRA